MEALAVGGLLSGLLVIGVILVGIFLLIALVLAPLKLYDIARELRHVNAQLQYANGLHKYMAETMRFQVEQLASGKAPPDLPR